MDHGLPTTRGLSRHPAAERIRRDARLYVDGLAERLQELTELAHTAEEFGGFEESEYARFKTLFLDFTVRTEEFQILSALAEETLALPDSLGLTVWQEHRELEASYRRLQITMLEQVIKTQYRLLQVWDDRWRLGAGLPYGSAELFAKAVQVIYHAKAQLLRPRYVSEVDEQTLINAEAAERLVRALIRRAPHYHEFGSAEAPAPGEPDQPFLPGMDAPVILPGAHRRDL